MHRGAGSAHSSVGVDKTGIALSGVIGKKRCFMKKKVGRFPFQYISRGISLFVSSTLLSFLLIGMAVSKVSNAQDPTVRVAVKTKVPLTQAIVDQLGPFGKVGHRMWKINLVDMRVLSSDLEKLAHLPIVQYIEQEQGVQAIPIETVPASISDFSSGISVFDLDMINVTDSDPHPQTRCNGTGDTRCVAYDGSGVYVAVVDTGLVPNWREFFPEERIDADHATGFTGGSNERSPWDDRGKAAVTDRLWEKDTDSHGTHVTSTILGYHLFLKEFGIDGFVNGVAPKATIIPIKVLTNGGFGSNLDIVAALYYLASLRNSGEITSPIVVNMSIGTLRPAQSLEDAIDFAIKSGVILVAAGGNEDDLGMAWPGAYPQMISAAAAGWKREWIGPTGIIPDPFFLIVDVPEEAGTSTESFITFFSSREKPGQQLDVTAPGMWTFGPALEHGAASPPLQSHGKPSLFTVMFGTSMASPHVAGTAALLLQKNPNLTQAEVECTLISSAIPIDPLPGVQEDPLGFPTSFWGDCPDQNGICHEEQGWGLIQANEALNCVGPGGVTCLPPAPGACK
jgi:subtilase family protein